MGSPLPTPSLKHLRQLYLANAAILLTHEIDSAYWHEWQLFHLPGGIQLFLLLNLLLVLLVLYGQDALARGVAAGFTISWLLVAGGLLAFTIHSILIIRGDPAFRLPVSLLLLVSTLVLSVIQGVVLRRYQKCG